MTAKISHQVKPWQNTYYGMERKIEALYYSGYISDLTINFPGTDIKYKAHKVFLALSSSVFEGMLFGPMAIAGSELELPDDNPEAFKFVLAHCYGVDRDMSTPGLDVALQVYMLADKYFMEELVNYYSYIIADMLNSENIHKVLEFASYFKYDSLKAKCYDIFGSRYTSNQCDVSDLTKALLVLRQEWLKELLETDISIPQLVFEKSWKYPDAVLCDNLILQVLDSKYCRNNGLHRFVGCASAKVVNNICKVSYGDSRYRGKQLCLSFSDLQQANDIISILENVKYPLMLEIHIQCKMIPVDGLKQLNINHLLAALTPWINLPKLILSNVDDDGIDWVVSTVRSLKPSLGCIYFPRSKLTFTGVKSLLTQLVKVLGSLPNVQIFSTETSSVTYKLNQDLDKWIQTNSIKMKDGKRVYLCGLQDEKYVWGC